MSKWQPISTASFDDGAEVDLWCVHPEHGGMRSANMQWDRLKKSWRDMMGMPLNPGWQVTHWKPLPSAPQSTPTSSSEPV